MIPAPVRQPVTRQSPDRTASGNAAARLARVLPAAAALAVAALLPGLPAQAAPPAPTVVATTALDGQACADGTGVTVVVDLTDLGEDVRVGCAEGDPTTGREALESAGFTTTDSVPGMICAVDGLPDPCPEEFDGNYWAYFSAEADGEWTARTEGADTADPVPGTFEGWRYNDGTTGPGVTTAELAAASTAQGGADGATAADTSDTADTQAAEDQPSDGPSTGLVVALGVAAVAVAVAAVLRRRRRED
jgi:hypothetical protein